MKSLIVMLSLSLCTLGALRLGFAEDAAPATPGPACTRRDISTRGRFSLR